jgi:hypothetical protein
MCAGEVVCEEFCTVEPVEAALAFTAYGGADEA